MSKKKQMIARAWTDRAYRASLSAEQLSALPANPAGDAGSEASLELAEAFTFGGGCLSLGCFTACTTGNCTNTCLCTAICESNQQSTPEARA